MIKILLPVNLLGDMMQNNIGEARRSYATVYGKFTQDDAAQFFGVASSTYKGWEQGVGKLNGEVLCAIADKYNCSVDYLLCRVDNPDPYPTSSSAGRDNRQVLMDKMYGKMSERGKEMAVEQMRMVLSLPENRAGSKSDTAIRKEA